ncbi:MAG: hypothetical protein HQM13_18880 [SAR324 cluster bacterium]|nr:hypothetical protein [SAR324 cluster bacterium]
MAQFPLLKGFASVDETQKFLDERFRTWKYQPSWKRSLNPNGICGSLLGLEFSTKDLVDLQKNLPQLLSMGCNHFQWVIEQSEELAFVHNSPFIDYFQNTDTRLVSRNGVILSLRLPQLPSAELHQIISLASKKFGVEQWDRIVITPDLSEYENLTDWDEHLKLESELGLNFQGGSDSQEMIEAMEKFSKKTHVQVPFNFIQFRNFLRRNWQFEGKHYAMPKLLEKWHSSVSFRSPFIREENDSSSSLFAEMVNESKNYAQDLQTLLSLLDASENRLNQNLQKWQQIDGKKVEMDDFQFISFLREACHSIQNVEEWEQYLSTLWFPPFQHHVRAWTLQIPEACHPQWRWMVNDFMENIHDLMGLQSEVIRSEQAARMRPFLAVVNQYFPEMPTITSFGAKTLLILASTPWPETVFFPWNNLDSTIEYLGLMRFPLLDNSGRILKELAKIEIS